MNVTLRLALFLVALSGILLGEDRQPGTPVRSLAITHVNLIPMDAERVLQDQTVVMQGERIISIGNDGLVKIPSDALKINGRDKYLMPGLIDLHVHLFSPDDFISYLSHGVTSVLDMSGSPLQLHWRQEARRRKILAPTIYTTGTTIDGWPPLNEQFVTAETPDEGRSIVQAQHAAGYDAVKLYGTLRPDVFDAILDESRNLKMPVFGHVNRQVGALGVLKSSQAMGAHLEDLMFARFDQPPTEEELVEFAKAIGSSKITVTPNLTVGPSTIAQIQDLGSVLNSAEARYLSPAGYTQWMPSNNRNPKEDDWQSRIQQIQDVQASLYKLVGLLDKQHVSLVLGTDAAAYGFPGKSAHEEVQELVKAGFSPYKALATGTVNAGKFIDRTMPGRLKVGSISEGEQADFILLSGNPLADVAALEKIDGVVLRGRWLPKSELDQLREQQKMRSATAKQELDKLDAKLDSGDVAGAVAIGASLDRSAEHTPWISEWVLITKARKLQEKNLQAALDIAKFATTLFPQSFSAWLLRADLEFRNRRLDLAEAAARRSIKLMPNSAARTLIERISISRTRPTLHSGELTLNYTNDTTGEAQHTTLALRRQNWKYQATFTDPDNKSSDVRELLLGGKQIWALKDSNYGAIEFRLRVDENRVSGYWAGPFGKNGKVIGTFKQ